MQALPSLMRAALVCGFALPFINGSLSAQGSETSQRILQHHFEFRPEGKGPFPAVVAMPGCSGIAFEDPALEATHPDLIEDDRLFRGHYPRAADRIRSEGFAVLVIHVHAAEGLVTACAGEIRDEVLAEYVGEAVRWVRELSYVDPSRVSVIGWSMGGRAVLTWLASDQSEWETVQSAAVVYPSCPGQGSLTKPVPLLILLGGADDIAEPDRCEALVARSRQRDNITIHRYPGARHGYDIEGAPPVLEVGGGMTVGFQKEATDATWREIFAFLTSGR